MLLRVVHDLTHELHINANSNRLKFHIAAIFLETCLRKFVIYMSGKKIAFHMYLKGLIIFLNVI